VSQVLFIRHGRTAWNDARRIQGHTDIPLSDAGRLEIQARSVPERFLSWPVFTSPLSRSIETARLLELPSSNPDPRLMEMGYGAWEGETWPELRERYGESLVRRERLGLDFRPDGGESPRELRTRLAAWLDEIRDTDQPVVAVTHKGVIRMALAMATGWDLVSKAPYRLRWECAHLFEAPSQSGRLDIVALNLSLARISHQDTRNGI
jgi:probable phosphoglycerate mutase